MILQRQVRFNIPEFQNKYEALIQQSGQARQVVFLEQLAEFAELIQTYSSAMNEVSTKLEILDSEFQTRHKHNPIHHLECRIKNIESIAGKLIKLGLPLEISSVRDNIFDIAGIRVICNYIDDVYRIADLLTAQSDIQVIRKKDYIGNPKPSGYRSLHLIVSVPVFLSDGVHVNPVEIQLRTVTMDFWASLEHKLHYKAYNSESAANKYTDKLAEYAGMLYEIEMEMQDIHRETQ
jgi:putative GTP pyrophosphokinase